MSDLGRRDALRLLAAQALVLGLVGAGCSAPEEPESTAEGSGAAQQPAPAAAGADTPAAVPAPGTFSGAEALTAAIGAIARGPKVGFGVGVVDARTGRRFVHDPSGPHEMASTVKVDLLTGLLVRAQQAGRDLTSGERARHLDDPGQRQNGRGCAVESQRRLRRNGDDLGRAGHDGDASGRARALGTELDERRGPAAPARRARRRESPGRRRPHGIRPAPDVPSDPRSALGVGGVARDGESVAVKNGWLPRPTDGGRWIVATTGRLTGPETDLRLAVLSHGHPTQRAGVTFTETVLRSARQHLGV